jgi:Cys-tRNA synthase (O-phospho-L-seryl-tRNA:Cys-tRNA synthase)
LITIKEAREKKHLFPRKKRMEINVVPLQTQGVLAATANTQDQDVLIDGISAAGIGNELNRIADDIKNIKDKDNVIGDGRF